MLAKKATGWRKMFSARERNQGLAKEEKIKMSPFYVEGDNDLGRNELQ